MEATEPAASRVVGPSKPRLLQVLGPGLISGAANDDPTAIATYSQAGARFGFGFCWLMPLAYPLMAIVQQVSARSCRHLRRGAQPLHLLLAVFAGSGEPAYCRQIPTSGGRGVCAER